MMFGIISVQY